MKIIDTPWLAIDPGSDRTHVAFQQSEQVVMSVETLESEFDSVFHVSKTNHVITVGRSAIEHLEADPGGAVLLRTGQLKTDELIPVPDGRCEIRSTALYTAMLRHIREYCEMRVFEGVPVRSCILAVPHRNDRIRRSYRKLAMDAGFQQVLFRDAVVAAATSWRHVWGEGCRYLIICNLAASHVSFSLLQSRHGGFERVENIHSSITTGIDEIDRIILETEYNASHPEDSNRFADLQRLKAIRRHCSMDMNKEEKYHITLGGRVRSIYPVHFQKAAEIVSKRIDASFRRFQTQCLKTLDQKAIPVALVGGGTNIPVIFESIERAAAGKVYWWGGAEEAVAMGTAMGFLPKRQVSNPTKEESHFFKMYLKAVAGNVQAQYYLGKCLEMGHGTATSPEEAYNWYLLAAKSGFHKAKYRLANLIHKGLGTVHDEGESLRLLHESAGEGYYLAQFLLGVYYQETDRGEEGEALKWLKMAAAQNFMPAIEFIEKHFGAEAVPPVTKSFFDESPDDYERDGGPHSGESVYPADEFPAPDADFPPPIPESAKERTAEVPLGWIFGMGLTALVFLGGSGLLYGARIENPVARYGSLGLLAAAGICALVTTFWTIRRVVAKPKEQPVSQM